MVINPQSILRLVIPQWQGGDEPAYRLGAKVLAAIAPEATGPTETIAVPVASALERPVEDGIVSRSFVLEQLEQTRRAIARHRPEAIVTLGGDCLVDLAPIAYLNDRYKGDLAVLWIDAHPDVMGPAQFAHAHAHVLGMLLGEGDAEFRSAVPRPLTSEQVLYVGIHDPNPFEVDFIKRRELACLAPEAVQSSGGPVIDWLRSSGKTHVAVHFDLDVLDPALYDFLLFRDPRAAPGTFDGVPQGRMTLSQVATILKAVSAEFTMVGLAITEYLPWSAYELSSMLEELPLFK